MQKWIVEMYCTTKQQQNRTILFTLFFIRAAAITAVALLSTVGNVVLEKMCKVFGGPD